MKSPTVAAEDHRRGKAPDKNLDDRNDWKEKKIEVGIAQNTRLMAAKTS